MPVSFSVFDMNHSVVAPVIYGTKQHLTTDKGVVISNDISTELKRFLIDFNNSVGVSQLPYYRIDAYFNEQSLTVLEVNASFVDGWGTALNLARASGISVDPRLLIFPERFASVSSVYLPELKLFLDEMATLGVNGHKVCSWDKSDTDPIYVYGRVGQRDQPNVLPYDGLRLDNKLNLGLFSREWSSDLVKIPKHYIGRLESWDTVPREAVLKFCDKGSLECQRARQSVLLGKPSGKAPFLKRCYNSESLLAQNLVEPAKLYGNNCQLIIFAVGAEPVCGYVQYSRNEIINDNSVHGPLQLG